MSSARDLMPRRRWPQLAAITALAAVVIFAAFSLLDSDDGRAPSVVAKAVEPKRQPSPSVETWHTTGGRMHWKAYAAKNGKRGRLLSEIAGQRRPAYLSADRAASVVTGSERPRHRADGGALPHLRAASAEREDEPDARARRAPGREVQ